MLIDSTRKLAVAAALCAALGAGSCGSDDQGSGNPAGPSRTWALTVIVSSEQSAPIPSATVRVMDGPNAARTATTDQSGTAVFSSLQEGSFNIEVTAQEFYRATASVNLNTSRTVNVAMKERNRAPVVKSLVSQGGLQNQPSGLADVGQALDVVANVTDAETPVANLAFDWQSDIGTLSGSGSSVRWRAPSSGSFPETGTIKVTITERFTEPGSTTVLENKTTGEMMMRVHDFDRESGGLAKQFLDEFSDSRIPAETVVRNFSTGERCAAGAASELQNVADNRTNYLIRTARIGAPSVAVHFQSSSPFRSRPGDAWIGVPCGWTSTKLADDSTEVVDGICRLTAIYDVDKWALCWSDFEANATSLGTRFIR